MKNLFAPCKGWLLAALLFGSLAAQAQTALIAHRSHGGGNRTFVPARSAHNFGNPVRYVPVKIVYLEGAQAVRYSEKWRVGRRGGPLRIDTVDVRRLTGQQFPDSVLRELRRLYPKVELVGFQSRKLNETWPSIDQK